MKLQKIILCAAALLTAFGASLGLLEIGSYLSAAFEPLKVEFKLPEPIASPVYAPARRIAETKTPVPAPTAAPETAQAPEDWIEDGYYYIIGDRPKGFAGFDYIRLDTHVYNKELNKFVPVKPSGWIGTEKEFFDLSRVNITNKRISLVSSTQKGISYQFDGKFIEGEEVKAKYRDGSGEYTDTVILKGRLTKWRRGVKIAEAQVKLGVTEGC